GLVVAQQHAVPWDVCPRRYVRRDLHREDLGELRHVRRRDVGPVRTAIARHLYDAGVGAGPEHVRGMRRRREREHRRVRLDTSLVLGDRSARRLHGARLRACQVGPDALPALPFIRALPDVLWRRLERLRPAARENEADRPLHALLQVLRGPAHRILRPDVDRTALAGHVVEAVQGASVAPGVEDVDDLGIVADVPALTAAGRVEELVRRRKVIPALRRHAYGAVVLLAAADVIRLVGGHADAIELCGRIVLLGPGAAAIEADVP